MCHKNIVSSSVEHPEQGEGVGGVVEREFAGAGERRKRLSVHVCYVNICMFVHFESK